MEIKSLGERKRPIGPGRGLGRNPSEPPLILVIEDNLDVRETLAEQLATLGYRVTSASTEPGLRILQTVAPDLVLTNVDIGATNGFEVCARVKGDRRLWRTRVIILTAFPEPASVAAGLTSGADDVIPKPWDFAELGSRVAKLLTRPPRVGF